MLIRVTTLWFAAGLDLLALIWPDRRWRLGARLGNGSDTPGIEMSPGMEGSGS